MISSGVDGNYYLHRAFSVAGKHNPTEGVFRTFLSLVTKDLLRAKARQFIIAFDGNEIFRYKIYQQYKANRKEDKVEGATTSRDIIYQTSLPYVQQKLLELKLPFIQNPKLEADDILASIAKQYPKVINLANDKDAYQYVTNTAFILETKGKDYKIIRPEDVLARYKVSPELMVMYQTLTGDASDNIPRIANITPSRAVKICNTYKTLTSFYKSLTKEEQKKYKHQLQINYKLVKLVNTENVKLQRMPKLKDNNLPLATKQYISFLYTQKSLF